MGQFAHPHAREPELAQMAAGPAVDGIVMIMAIW